MPSIGFGEIIIVLLFALIIFGPKRLPEMGRTIGKGLREFRRAASDIRSELDLDVEETPRASVEERTRRLNERDRALEADETPEPEEPAPPRGEAPPT